jgi:hypothetical protein
LTGFVLAQQGDDVSTAVQVNGASVVVLRRDELPPGSDPTAGPSYTQLSVSATTNQYGQYFFVDLPDGNYIVRATSGGVSGESDEVNVDSHLANAIVLKQ